LIHVLPLSSGERRDAGVPHGTTAAVFVRKAVLDDLNSLLSFFFVIYSNPKVKSPK
jgi:hypothetical protein